MDERANTPGHNPGHGSGTPRSDPSRSNDHRFVAPAVHGLCYPPAVIVDVIIPALNEEEALPHVLREIPHELVRDIIVADNGSTDRTADVAREEGAKVVTEHEKGYGAACLRAMRELEADPPDVVVFLDGDHSDYPEELPLLLQPIKDGNAQLVIGSRDKQRAGLTPQQRVGNRVACIALRGLYGVSYTDLGPFRAITYDALMSLGMADRNWGWTVEMQIKAAQLDIAYAEVPVRYRERIGVSKVSGTVRGTLGASAKILWLLGRHVLSDLESEGEDRRP